MPLREDIIEAINKWLAAMRRDGRFARSKASKMLAEYLATLDVPKTMTEVKVVLTFLMEWVTGSLTSNRTDATLLKVNKKTGELLRTVNGMLSREGLSLNDVSNR